MLCYLSAMAASCVEPVELSAAQIFRVARFEPEDENREPVLFVFQRLETEDDAEEEEEEEEEEARMTAACTHANALNASLSSPCCRCCLSKRSLCFCLDSEEPMIYFSSASIVMGLSC